MQKHLKKNNTHLVDQNYKVEPQSKLMLWSWFIRLKFSQEETYCSKSIAVSDNMMQHVICKVIMN